MTEPESPTAQCGYSALALKRPVPAQPRPLLISEIAITSSVASVAVKLIVVVRIGVHLADCRDNQANQQSAGRFDFPVFESKENRFRVRLDLDRSDEFREFVRRRSQSLGQLEEILVLRLLWVKDIATLSSARAR